LDDLEDDRFEIGDFLAVRRESGLIFLRGGDDGLGLEDRREVEQRLLLAHDRVL